MFPAVGNGFGATDKILAVPFPQALEGVTEIFPVPAPTVTVIELPVPLLVHPAGNTQV
jgi:hypothetical protein